jgi:hypothetical protein
VRWDEGAAGGWEVIAALIPCTDKNGNARECAGAVWFNAGSWLRHASACSRTAHSLLPVASRGARGPP